MRINSFKITLGLTLVLFWGNLLIAQDLNKDFKKVAEKFERSNFKMDVQMKELHWNKAHQPIVVKGEVKRKGDNYLTDFGGQVNLINNHVQLMVYKSEKSMIYVNLDESRENQSNENSVLPDQKLFNKNAILIQADANGKIYEIKHPHPGMKRMRLKIDPTNILREVKYYYEKIEGNPVKEVIITYSNVVFNPGFSVSDFSEKKYFNIVNNQAIPAIKYKEYKITKVG